MMSVLPRTLCLVTLMGLTTSGICAQSRSLEPTSEHPRKAIPYAGTIELKITSRKLVYHVDDLISIDIAMLNVSKTPVYVEKSDPGSLRLSVTDEAGASIDVRRYVLIQRSISTESFELLEGVSPLWNGSLLVLAGCQSGELKRYFVERDKLLEDEQQGADYPAEAFRRGLYANYGEACLDLGPGTYRVVVTASNDYVIVDRHRPQVRTAVGDLRSNELVIRVLANGAVEAPPN